MASGEIQCRGVRKLKSLPLASPAGQAEQQKMIDISISAINACRQQRACMKPSSLSTCTSLQTEFNSPRHCWTCLKRFVLGDRCLFLFCGFARSEEATVAAWMMLPDLWYRDGSSCVGTKPVSGCYSPRHPTQVWVRSSSDLSLPSGPVVY